jgi:hypothetical protein
MENHLLQRIDTLIEKYKKDHKGEPPLYAILSADENKEVMRLIRESNNLPEDHIVTTYKGVKLAHHPQQTNGKIYVSNELPETGS